MSEQDDGEVEHACFEAIVDVSNRWGLTADEAEAFLASHNYFASILGGHV